jgi:hypothetical protein
MSLPSSTLHLLLSRRDPLLAGLHVPDRLLLLPVLGLLLLLSVLLLPVLGLLLLLSVLPLLLLRSLPGLLLMLGTLLLRLSTLLLLRSLPGLLLMLGTLRLGLSTLLLLRSLPGLLLMLGTLRLGLSTLGGWGLLGRLGLLVLLLLMLCAGRNCDAKNQEQKCSADDSDVLHSVLLPMAKRVCPSLQDCTAARPLIPVSSRGLYALRRLAPPLATNRDSTHQPG